MPVFADHSKPIRTVDTTGKLVSTSTNNAAPIKTVDSVGRAVKQDAQAVAEKAAETLPNFANGQTSAPQTPPEEKQPDKTAQGEGEKVSEAQIRKEYLEAQRIKRQAQEMAKQAKASLEKAEAFEKARALAESGEDPTAILKAAGIDHVKFYRAMTDYALSEKGRKEETDPIKREVNEHKQQLEEYKKRLDEQARVIQEREEIAAHNQVIQEHVIPILRDNPERYEILLAHYGNQAAVEVYKNVWEIYQQTGKARKFQEVADEMEKYWSDTMEAGLNTASKLKKFGSRFAQSGSPAPNEIPKSERHETPNGSPTLSSGQSPTLSNKQQITTTSKNPYKGMTKEERVAAILKKFDS